MRGYAKILGIAPNSFKYLLFEYSISLLTLFVSNSCKWGWVLVWAPISAPFSSKNLISSQVRYPLIFASIGSVETKIVNGKLYLFNKGKAFVKIDLYASSIEIPIVLSGILFPLTSESAM